MTKGRLNRPLFYSIIDVTIIYMEEKNEEQIKPSFKELFLDYKEQKTRPIKRFFNTIYVVFTLIAYFYYLVYAILHIVKNGLENPISILLILTIKVYLSIGSKSSLVFSPIDVVALFSIVPF